MSNHPTCITCAWFRQTNTSFGVCLSIGMCSSKTKRENEKQITAYVVDGEDYYAEFQPSPRFYCALHSALPEPGS